MIYQATTGVLPESPVKVKMQGSVHLLNLVLYLRGLEIMFYNLGSGNIFQIPLFFVGRGGWTIFFSFLISYVDKMINFTFRMYDHDH